MARYIDADNFRKTMIKRFGCIPCLTDYSEASRYDIPLDDALNLAPIADVIPKSEVVLARSDAVKMLIECHGYALTHDADIKKEVAREIFEELENVAKIYTFPVVRMGVIEIVKEPFWCIEPDDFTKLKKKYTENENG